MASHGPDVTIVSLVTTSELSRDVLRATIGRRFGILGYISYSDEEDNIRRWYLHFYTRTLSDETTLCLDSGGYLEVPYDSDGNSWKLFNRLQYEKECSPESPCCKG